jgi:hypothetical protein
MITAVVKLPASFYTMPQRIPDCHCHAVAVTYVHICIHRSQLDHKILRSNSIATKKRAYYHTDMCTYANTAKDIKEGSIVYMLVLVLTDVEMH